MAGIKESASEIPPQSKTGYAVYYWLQYFNDCVISKVAMETEYKRVRELDPAPVERRRRQKTNINDGRWIDGAVRSGEQQFRTNITE